MQQIEETLAHLIRSVEDLSDILSRQQDQIDRLAARVDMLMQREGQRDSEGGGGVILGDERPPHY